PRYSPQPSPAIRLSPNRMDAARPRSMRKPATGEPVLRGADAGGSRGGGTWAVEDIAILSSMMDADAGTGHAPAVHDCVRYPDWPPSARRLRCRRGGVQPHPPSAC